MSVNKANQISESLKEEEQWQHQILPFTIATVEAPSSLQNSNLFNSSNVVQERSNIELSEFSEQDHQHPCDPFSLEAEKYSEFQTSEAVLDAPINWMSSKMRLMRKMMAQEEITMKKPRGKIGSLLNTEIKSENISSSGTVIRVCSACNTTKTPLWRSGPQGPKSLCNACGIRRMKARRAAAITSTIQNKAVTVRNSKKIDVKRTIPYKKRYKFTTHDVDHEKPKFEDSSTSLLASSTIFHPTFPQDEKDAAILLMTLSFG